MEEKNVLDALAEPDEGNVFHPGDDSYGDVAAQGTAGGAVEGAVEAAVEGAVKGEVEGAVEGEVEGAVEGEVEGAVEGAVSADEAAISGNTENLAEVANPEEVEPAAAEPMGSEPEGAQPASVEPEEASPVVDEGPTEDTAVAQADEVDAVADTAEQTDVSDEAVPEEVQAEVTEAPADPAPPVEGEAAEEGGNVFDALDEASAGDGQGELEGGNVFDALDEDEGKIVVEPLPSTADVPDSTVYRVPVNLHKDEEGKDFFYLQKGTFPNRSITRLNIAYGDEEKEQVREQVMANNTCAEVILKNVLVECCLSGESVDGDESKYLSDNSFRLSHSKIAAIRMRMYSDQKKEAEIQLEDPNNTLVFLRCDIECRLASKEKQ